MIVNTAEDKRYHRGQGLNDIKKRQAERRQLQSDIFKLEYYSLFFGEQLLL